MVPILVNYPEEMLKVRVAAMKDSSSSTVADLQRLGALHVEEASAGISPGELQAASDRLSSIGKALADIDELLGRLKGQREVRVPALAGDVDTSEAMRRVGLLKDRVSSTAERGEQLLRRMASLKEHSGHLDDLGRVLDITLSDLYYDGTYLFSRVLAFSREAARAFLAEASGMLLHRLSVESGPDTVIYLVARARDRHIIEQAASNLGGNPLPVMDGEHSLREFNENRQAVLDNMADKLETLETEIQQIISSHLEQLVGYRELLRREYSRLEILKMAAAARYVTLLEGWVPAGEIDRFATGLSRGSGQMFIDSRPPEPGEDPPTRMKNPAGIRPFEVIVKLFSVPRYGEWDPTPSIAYFFAFFFGLMLNDVAYALGLFLLVWTVLDKLVDDPAAPGAKLFKRVLLICASTALVTGLLTGGFMGDFATRFLGIAPERIALAGAVQRALSEPITFIIISLVIGLLHLNIAHILGLVRGIRERSPGVVINKAGLFMIQIFGIPYLFHAMLGMDIPGLNPGAYAVFGWLLGAGVLGVIAGSLVQMGGIGSIFWIFDLTGILGDVMSYSRLAGVGLATFYLASSFNLLSDLVAAGLGGVLPGIFGTVLGFLAGLVLLTVFHIFNLLLGTLAAFIHSLRLCFVEFLLKFYEGGGREYSPFHLPQQRTVLVGRKIS
ncbi:MAG: V-type ATPase 116kDa subunit family protein [Desulfomonilia bacterium]|jgi:V/A-type H+-transporting ATPase subunit I